jgi:hypothetical protein
MAINDRSHWPSLRTSLADPLAASAAIYFASMHPRKISISPREALRATGKNASVCKNYEPPRSNQKYGLCRPTKKELPR